jgi:ATP-dependent helicase/nuclease subunit B
MTVRFLLGAAGSGKTFRCLAEVREDLTAAVDGLPLVFLAPKQATFQLERALLSDGLEGYTRLQILSFERLSRMILEEMGNTQVELLDEEGRRMVLRALLADRYSELRVFRATARLPGFAGHLSEVLGELQRQKIGPEALLNMADPGAGDERLNDKLHDLALLLDGYLGWLRDRQLQDHLALLDLATSTLQALPPDNAADPTGLADRENLFDGLWLDGFAELTVQELELLTELVTRSRRSTLAFCLPSTTTDDPSWLSCWSAVHSTWQKVFNRLTAVPGLRTETVQLPEARQPTRFLSSPVLQQLASHWDRPWAIVRDPSESASVAAAVRMAVCDDPEAEAILAAREILAHVRKGSHQRFREVGVLLRTFEGYHDVVSRVFRRYEIPFFIDRREPVTHHPLAELTRYALRTVAFHWRHDDWLGALKSGLVPAPQSAIDELENEALARGWEGSTWLEPLSLPEHPALELRLERTRRRLVPPFHAFAETITAGGGQANGRQLTKALLALWSSLRVQDRLEHWSSLDEADTLHDQRIGAVHRAVWEQMQSWLENLERAFAARSLSLSQWLPILESGLNGLSVGVIPPALDQVMIGTIDRSRNPDLDLVVVLGLNDTIFPAPPPRPGLLTEPDRRRLEGHGLRLDPGWHGWLSREHYYGYIALTRARCRLVLTCAEQDGQGRALNPSPFLARAERALPGLCRERFVSPSPGQDAEHWTELLAAAIASRQDPDASPEWALISPLLPEERRGQIATLAAYAPGAVLSTAAARALYGPVLQTSVSSLEQFAACPFRFFVQTGLRAGVRRRFEVDAKEKGSFQHEVLARFHRQLQSEGQRWRDLTPTDGRSRVAQIAEEMTAEFRDGLFQSAPEALFEAERLGRLLQDYIEVAIGWMKSYRLDPVAVELGFGGRSDLLPAWELPLDTERRLAIRGTIDRVDLLHDPATGQASCVVMDYKSSDVRLDNCLLAHGIQIQLPAYLAALRRLPEAPKLFNVQQLVPAGMFYVNLRGRHEGRDHREEVLDSASVARRKAYQHAGRFNASLLRLLDCRQEAVSGEQFNYRLTTKGTIYTNCQDPVEPRAFEQILDRVEAFLRECGLRIYAGDVGIDPYQHGTSNACARCDAHAVCRIDPWTHRYRILDPPGPAEEGPET